MCVLTLRPAAGRDACTSVWLWFIAAPALTCVLTRSPVGRASVWLWLLLRPPALTWVFTLRLARGRDACTSVWLWFKLLPALSLVFALRPAGRSRVWAWLIGPPAFTCVFTLRPAVGRGACTSVWLWLCARP